MTKANNYNFSVAMCVYHGDNPKHFHESIESILNQTVIPSEVVLVVDGPVNDEIEKVIKQYMSHEIFNIIRLDENVGHGKARQVSIENCKYELVALMDADDISLSTRFEKQLECFSKDNNVSVVGGLIDEFIDEEDNIVGRRIVPKTNEEIKKYLKKRCPMNQVTVMFKVSDVLNSGGYIDWHYEEDYYLWIRMYQHKYKFYNIQETLVLVRVGIEMYSRRGGWKYFTSERKLQKYMHKYKIINLYEYIRNVFVRFILQVIVPTKIRGILFKKFARQK